MQIGRSGLASAFALAVVGLASCGDGDGELAAVSIGGVVSGLAGNGLVLADNATDHLSVASNGSFTFATKVPADAAYDVTILAQPVSPSQTCAVAGGAGQAGTGQVVDVKVTCTTNHYTVGGAVSGLAGSGLALQNNGGDNLTVTSDGSFTFATPLASGAAYGVTVLMQPRDPVQVCRVSVGIGAVAAANVSSVAVTCVTSMLSLLAGNMGGAGTADGVGAAARFWESQGVATDTAGNVYVADTENDTIREITPAGAVTTFAGTAHLEGSTDGVGAAAGFLQPHGVATDTAGNVYVADTQNNTIRKITPSGVVTTLAGQAGVSGSADGIGTGAKFYMPTGVATDAAGNVYVADSYNWTIRKITPAGVVTTFAGQAGVSGSADGTGAAARFLDPTGVATDAAGDIYVADSGNDTIRKITPTGVVTTLAGQVGVEGAADGIGNAAQFRGPQGLTVDATGNIYVADTYNYTIRKITPIGAVTTLAGVVNNEGSTDGVGRAALFDHPIGVAADAAGNIYVADEANSIIRKITPAAVVSTFAGQSPVTGAADGTGAAAQFTDPQSLAADTAGNVYVTDVGFHGYPDAIRKITPAGLVTTLAVDEDICGAGNYCYLGGIATDADGNIYAGDLANCTVRKFTSAGLATTLAGRFGVCGSVDGVGPAAEFSGLAGLAAAAAGNIYVADNIRNTIRKITPAGVVTTLAGQSGVSGSADGSGTAATFHSPSGVAIDAADNIYVADSGNCTIRKITPTGVVTTLAGQAGVSGSADGIGTAATFSTPSGVATDGSGNIYVADSGNYMIRKITPTGVVSTVIGVSGQEGFQAGALPGLIGLPAGVAISGSSLYITTFYGVAVVHDFP